MPELPFVAHPLSPHERATLALRLDDLLRFLGAPGDWGYDTELGGFTLMALRMRALLNGGE